MKTHDISDLDRIDEGKGVFVNLTSNTGFKHAVADHDNERSNKALKALLNYYLPEDSKIEEITEYLNTEIPGFTLFNKNIVVDIRCKDARGNQFICEMQAYYDDDYFVRTLAYLTSVYRETLGSGKNGYKSLMPVYLVAFIKHRMKEQRNDDHRLVSKYEFRDTDENYLLPSQINAIFVRLNEVPEAIEDCTDQQQECAWILRYGHLLSEMPKVEAGSGMEDIMKAAQIAAFDDKKKRQYNQEIMFERDYYSQMETYTRIGHDAGLAEGKAAGLAEGEAKGRAEGKAEGRDEGRAEGKAELVSKAYASGKTAKDIAEFLGMTVDEIKAMLTT